MHTVLSIAGSDCSGGAGIQADLKTISAHKMYGMTAITSLTAQNTTGITGIYDISAEFLKQQLDAVFTDIFPDAVKIGMVSNSELIHTIAECIKYYKPKNIVTDTVMISTSGKRLLSENASDVLINELLPLSDIITPNIPEAEFLSSMKIHSNNDKLLSAQKISEKIMKNKAVLIKGGHSINNADDILYINNKAYFFSSERINNPNTHGTGCTLSSAIACNLAKGLDIADAVINAKEYITGAIKDGLNLGKGNGPLNHMYNITFKPKGEYIE
jgi:hydroxymethylpyrimidine/phosphomethylpyrimidine kinase